MLCISLPKSARKCMTGYITWFQNSRFFGVQHTNHFSQKVLAKMNAMSSAFKLSFAMFHILAKEQNAD